MEKKVIIPIFIAMIFFAYDLFSQQFIPPRENILFANLGLKQSFIYKHPNSPMLVDGFAEFLMNDNFSIKGNCNQFITDRNKDRLMVNLTGITFGGAYHYRFTNAMHDVSFILQPGISWIELNQNIFGGNSYSSILPTLTTGVQYTIIFSRFCNFYLAVLNHTAYFRGTESGSVNLSGASITGGLGFHLLIKNKKTM